MYYLIENGRIIDSSKIVVCDDYVPFFNIKDGNIAKLKIINQADSLDLAKQRLIEYCVDKEKVLLSLWIKNLQKSVNLDSPSPKIIINEKITKDYLIAQLVNLNEYSLSGKLRKDRKLLSERIQVLKEKKQWVKV